MNDIHFYRNQLNSSQSKNFYDEIVAQIKEGNLGGIYRLNMNDRLNASNDAFDAMHAVIYDRPDFFFLGRMDRTLIRGGDLTLYNEILYTSSQSKRINILLEKGLDKIYRESIHDDVISKELKVYKNIATMITYENNNDEIDHNIVGPLLRGRGVCESYAKYLMLALRKVGIPCIRVSGVGRSEHHCWNIAWINSVPYHLDVTWEDVTNNGKRVSTKYFNLTDREISKDHLILSKGLPKCNKVFKREELA